MKRKDFILKQLYYSSYDHRWHADPNYTYKVLDVMVLPDNAIGVQLIRKRETVPLPLYSGSPIRQTVSGVSARRTTTFGLMKSFMNSTRMSRTA